MDVYLDDRTLTPSATAATLGQVIDEARAEAARGDRVIVGIRCDGEDITEGDLAARLAEPADTYSRVDLESGRPEQLVIDAMYQAQEVLEDSDAQRAQVVDWLAQGDTAQAKQGLLECFQNWTQVHQAIVQSMAFLRLDEKELVIEGRPLGAEIADICGQLQQVKEVLEVGDDVLLGDLLQYEFDAAIGKWRAVVSAVLDRAQR